MKLNFRLFSVTCVFAVVSCKDALPLEGGEAFQNEQAEFAGGETNSANASQDYLYLDEDEEADAEESVANEEMIRNFKSAKEGLRQLVHTEILECAGVDLAPFQELKAKRDELKDSGLSRDEAREEIKPLRAAVKESVSAARDQLKECREQLKSEQSPGFAAIQALRAACRPNRDGPSKKGMGGRHGDFKRGKKKGGKFWGKHPKRGKGHGPKGHGPKGHGAKSRKKFDRAALLEAISSDSCQEAVMSAQQLL